MSDLFLHVAVRLISSILMLSETIGLSKSDNSVETISSKRMFCGFFTISKALIAVDFPVPFAPTMSVKRPSGKVASRKALKFL